MFFDFGFADYSIPLGILDWYEAQWWGISEIALRLPMVACGLATLVVFPLYVAPRLGGATSALFALLVAISPLLVVFSRMARPYAITLLLGWIAHGAFQRYHASTRGQTPAGLTYGAATALATWLHPIVALFVLAPMLWALAELRRVAPAERRARLSRLASLAIPTCGLIAVLVLPPLFAHPRSLAAKSGADMPGVDTLMGVWYAWLGTPSTAVVILCLGAGGVRRARRLARIARSAHRDARCRSDAGRGHADASDVQSECPDARALSPPVPSAAAARRGRRHRAGRPPRRRAADARSGAGWPRESWCCRSSRSRHSPRSRQCSATRMRKRCTPCITSIFARRGIPI